ncbi:hypothetical protein E2C01_056637 [Portunus trituberculatus]|uniref:Uncharacterized protein n=1 Tax=Portunus trituberculatus TaxID=210409 RepID=A0A5B7GUP0_PORTR|nr:hypothetical protein [Portunus trituberculatus]
MIAKVLKPSTSQPTLMQIVTRTQPYKTDSKAKKEIDELVTEWIVKDMMPLSAVESKTFKRLLHRLDPKYELPIHSSNVKLAEDRLVRQMRSDDMPKTSTSSDETPQTEATSAASKSRTSVMNLEYSR